MVKAFACVPRQKNGSRGFLCVLNTTQKRTRVQRSPQLCHKFEYALFRAFCLPASMQKRMLMSVWRYSVVEDYLHHFTFLFCIDQWHRLHNTRSKTLYHAVFAAAHLNATQIDIRLLRTLQLWAHDHAARNNFFASLFMQLIELHGDLVCDHTDESCMCTSADRKRQTYREGRDDVFFMTQTVPMPGYAHIKINMFEACLLFAARASQQEMQALMRYLGSFSLLFVALCV